ncbi:radical SAM protein [Glycomyces buryatensis]|uniref:Radical SAM protein n=1 Tax=Glycomyces buryatensis TaxID=2570927 RepID=A0A4S8Q4V5_9ACTN|nr:radical SAM protein [Glycomyces buryatensis]THV37625.1 radical SAM protein [Glycomyces buryatensis]
MEAVSTYGQAAAGPPESMLRDGFASALARAADGTGSTLTGLGLVADGFATVQIDLNVVHKESQGSRAEITLCDHNCTTTVHGVATGGNYTCPAAMSLNRGARSTSLAPGAKLLEGLLSTIDGIRTAQQEFLTADLEAYFERESIPEALRPDYTAALSNRKIVVNLFGGSPETHPDVLEIIEGIQGAGAEVHLTTTGRRIVSDERFLADFLARPPEVIGLGADDFESADDVDRLFSLGFDELARLWRTTPWQHGQRRKAIEAVQICKMAQEHEGFPAVLFNIVLHRGNLKDAAALLDRLSHHTDGRAVLNPYPVQTAFMGQRGELGEVDLHRLSEFADTAIQVHRDRLTGEPARWNLAPRIGYWILMRALLDGSAVEASDRVGGKGVWQCYSRRGAGRCVQVGMAARSSHETALPGGHLGCFWNHETVTDNRQFWDLDTRTVADWVLEGRRESAAGAEWRCRGCLFPRMSMDAVSLELGLTSASAEPYRRVRARYLGY